MLYPLLTLCIIAQLCASALFIMHKAIFFHFLHKRENPSFLAFGQNARVLPAAAFCFHIYYVFANKYFRFLNVFVVFRCKCTTYLVKVLTPSFFICNIYICSCRFCISFAGARPSSSGRCASWQCPHSAP